MTTQAFTIETTTKLRSLINSTANYDSIAIDLNKAHDERAKDLDALRKMGYKTVQSGKTVRYKDIEPMPGEMSYKLAEREFTESFITKAIDKAMASLGLNELLKDFLKRVSVASTDTINKFVASNPNEEDIINFLHDNIYTEKQIKERVKKDIQSLSYWLSSGKFLTNVGRDKNRAEFELASEAFEADQFQLKQAEARKKELEKIADKNRADAKKMQDQVKQEQERLKSLVKPEAIAATQERLTRIQAAQEKINTQVKEDTRAIKELDKTVNTLSAKADESKKQLDTKQAKVKQPVKSNAPATPASAAKVQDVIKHDTGVKDIPATVQVSKEADFRAKELLAILRGTEDEAVLIRMAQIIIGEHNAQIKQTKAA
jgi:hypothetical protein